MTQVTVDLLPEGMKKQIAFHYGDITDGNFLSDLPQNEKPGEIYHLAEQSSVGYSFQNALLTYEAIKDSSLDTGVYFAATLDLLG